TNYVALGEPGFAALTALIAGIPSIAIDYPDGDSAVAQVEALCAAP
ncbi:HprK-related kinase A, partial [Xanthomonas citri pv. citri]|nr:HprK-related kinase A [Xanthomonas citri pv. citri]